MKWEDGSSSTQSNKTADSAAEQHSEATLAN
jgi:hypothetical protein